MKTVYLVGAGPGDPGLLTLKGRSALEQADCVLYDNLANAALLEYAPRAAERIYVGKKKSSHALTQEEICDLLLSKARAGKSVVRLKGGDPYIFGRGGEEAEVLADAGIPFEVVPGVTTPLGIAAYCGVPLTHREHTSAVTFVTGHSVEAIDWGKIGHAETLVLFMGLTHVREIASALIANGKDPQTPAIAVRWATRPDQQTVAGTLSDIEDLAGQAHLRPPVSIVIGDVVSMREKLNWFERLPLFGQRILVTRAGEQAGEFSARLRALGAEPVALPVIATVAAEDPAPLDEAIARLASYDWLIFTSVNGVRFFLERLTASAFDLRQLRGRICAIGPATRQALEALHLKVDLMPAEYVAESLVEAFAPFDLQGRSILLPRAAVARDVVPRELAARGARVDVVEAYRTIVPGESRSLVADVFSRPPHWVTFTSSSTVKNFLSLAGAESLRGVKIASIGPVTSDTARRHGLEVTVEAKEHTTAGLLAAILSVR
ncbi:MAG: uroporphyrinogen-III C-methyltransferase [Candidatus Solibacter usitatus]|nr:uroporphyrinogen-III C-methyltransferase [Candidatus Solibacter usitatus]